MFEFNLSDISINSGRSKSFKVEVQYSVLLLQVVKEPAMQTPPPPFSDPDPPHLVCTLGGHCMGKGRVYTNMLDLHNRSPGIEPIPRHWFRART
jgi:hypothetical protein